MFIIYPLFVFGSSLLTIIHFTARILKSSCDSLTRDVCRHAAVPGFLPARDRTINKMPDLSMAEKKKKNNKKKKNVIGTDTDLTPILRVGRNGDVSSTVFLQTLQRKGNESIPSRENVNDHLTDYCTGVAGQNPIGAKFILFFSLFIFFFFTFFRPFYPG